jgi:transposase
MINIDLTEEEMQALNYERFHHSDLHVQRKMEGILLKSQKLSHKDICRLTGISPNTLRGYLRAYLKGGIDALKELNFYKHQSELCQHTKTIEAYFREHLPASVKEVIAKIEELTGIQGTENRVREFSGEGVP